jgi:hypothetical protein
MPDTNARRRWPLLLIGGAAGTATWSGWVGLGELTGFGVVKPLPGIWDDFQINTAITLPIGVEAYAIYALSIATSDPKRMPARVRTYAWVSAAAALVLGMAGQIAYHLMSADGVKVAPAWVTAVVSSLPVLVLGAASLLWHFAGAVERGTVTKAYRWPWEKDDKPAPRPGTPPAGAQNAPAGTQEPPAPQKPAQRRAAPRPDDAVSSARGAKAEILAHLLEEGRAARDAGEPWTPDAGALSREIGKSLRSAQVYIQTVKDQLAEEAAA